MNVLSKFDIFIVVFLFSICSIVLVEPAPFDILFCGVFLFFLVRLRFFKTNSPIFIFFVFFATINILTIIFADNIYRAISFSTITIYLMFLGVFISSFVGTYKEEGVKLIIKGYIIACVISITGGILGKLGFLNFLSAISVNSYRTFRMQGFFKDPNVFAPFLILATTYVFNKIDNKINDEKSIKIDVVFLFLLVICIVLSLSRGAWINFAFTTLTFYVAKNFVVKKHRADKKLIFFFFVIFGICIISFTSLMFLNEKDLFLSRFMSQRYDTDRFFVHKIAISESLNDFWGIGSGQAEGRIASFYTNITMSGAAHSSMIRVFWENGWIGLFSYLAILIYTISIGISLSFNSWKFNELSIILTANFLGTLVNGLVIDTLHWRHFWIILGLIHGLNILYHKKDCNLLKLKTS